MLNQLKRKDMAERQSHFVLVHGACHGAWCWYKVATLLKSSGHKVTALDLAASGIHPMKVTDIHSLSDYCEPLTGFMRSLQPEKRVILVGHSLGGLCLSVAMENFPNKISAAVFATAFMPSPDLSFPTFLQEFRKQFDSFMDTTYFFDNGADNPPTSSALGPKCMAENLYQLSPPEDLTLATLLVRPAPVFDEGAKITKEKYGSVPRVYLICDKDMMFSEGLQRLTIEKDPTNIEVKIISGSDHMVMFSKPQEMCSCLEEIAKKYL